MMREIDQIEEKIETDKVIVARRKDGILHVYYKRNTVLTHELQLEMIGYFNQLSKEKCPFIFESASGVKMTQEAREKATSLESQMPISCSTIFAENFFIKVLGSFYLKIKKPKTPYIVSTNFSEAIRWLKETHSRQLSS